MGFAAFDRLIGKKSDNGDLCIEAHVGKFDYSLDLAGHGGAYEDELRIYPTLSHLLYVGDA